MTIDQKIALLTAAVDILTRMSIINSGSIFLVSIVVVVHSFRSK